MRLERLAEEIGQAGSEQDCWRVVAAAARDFGFCTAQLSLNGNAREEIFIRSEERWSLRVPLNESDYLVLTRPFDSGVLPMMVAAFLDTVRRELRTKLQEWNQELPVA
jgi:hypothetical protein